MGQVFLEPIAKVHHNGMQVCGGSWSWDYIICSIGVPGGATEGKIYDAVDKHRMCMMRTTYPPKVKTELHPQVADSRCLGDRATTLDIDHLLRYLPPIQRFLEEREDPP